MMNKGMDLAAVQPAAEFVHTSNGRDRVKSDRLSNFNGELICDSL